MTAQLIALKFAAQIPARLASFWAELLGRIPHTIGTRLPGSADTDFELRFVAT